MRSLNSASNPERQQTSGLSISFGHTCDRLLAGMKTVTRRQWKEKHAQKFIKAYREGKRVKAIDKDFRYGGKQVGWLCLTEEPRQSRLFGITPEDCVAEGYPELSPAEFYRKFFNRDNPSDEIVWVLTFKFEPTPETPQTLRLEDLPLFSIIPETINRHESPTLPGLIDDNIGIDQPIWTPRAPISQEDQSKTALNSTEIFSLLKERITDLTIEAEGLEAQARIHREEISQLQGQAKLYKRDEFDAILQELREAIAEDYGLTDYFCNAIKRFHEEVCSGSECQKSVEDNKTSEDNPREGTIKISSSPEDNSIKPGNFKKLDLPAQPTEESDNSPIALFDAEAEQEVIEETPTFQNSTLQMWTPKAQRWKVITQGEVSPDLQEFQFWHRDYQVYFLKDGGDYPERIIGAAVVKNGWAWYCDTDTLFDGVFAADKTWHKEQSKMQIDRLIEKKAAKPAKKEPSSLPLFQKQPKKDEEWYFEKAKGEKSLYCTNFDFRQQENITHLENLKARITNRGRKRLQQCCDWAVAEGFAKSYSILESDSPLKKLSDPDTQKPEVEIVLAHPVALDIIFKQILEGSPPRPTLQLGQLGELFFPGDRVKYQNGEDEYIVSYLSFTPREYHSWFICLTNALTGRMSRKGLLNSYSEHSEGLELIEAAPDFGDRHKTYQGMKVGERVSLKEVALADSQTTVQISQWFRKIQTDPSKELRIAAVLDDGQVVLYESKQNGELRNGAETAIFPPTALIRFDSTKETSGPEPPEEINNEVQAFEVGSDHKADEWATFLNPDNWQSGRWVSQPYKVWSSGNKVFLSGLNEDEARVFKNLDWTTCCPQDANHFRSMLESTAQSLGIVTLPGPRIFLTPSASQGKKWEEALRLKFRHSWSFQISRDCRELSIYADPNTLRILEQIDWAASPGKEAWWAAEQIALKSHPTQEPETQLESQ